MIRIQIARLPHGEGLPLPAYATRGAAGMDVDSDYRGELKILMINHGPESFPVRRGERIAQLVPAAVTLAGFDEVEELEATTRGAGGFGSTGR